jgi:hypothetical protein
MVKTSDAQCLKFIKIGNGDDVIDMFSYVYEKFIEYRTLEYICLLIVDKKINLLYNNIVMIYDKDINSR